MRWVDQPPPRVSPKRAAKEELWRLFDLAEEYQARLDETRRRIVTLRATVIAGLGVAAGCGAAMLTTVATSQSLAFTAGLALVALYVGGFTAFIYVRLL